MKFKTCLYITFSFLYLTLYKSIACNQVKRSGISFHLNLNIPDQSNSFQEENKTKYIGAVLEYEPYNKWTEDGQGYEVMRKNARKIVKFAKKAKSYNADILITPEYGVQSLNMYENNTEKFLTFTQYVPEPSLRKIICNQQGEEQEITKKYEAMQILSCGALRNKIYIVVDLAEIRPCSETTVDQSLPWSYEVTQDCPQRGYYIYNTQVVFDRDGAVVARYRKQNLYLEPLFTPGPKKDVEAIFVTDFDVAFSLQICFDILFQHPGYENSKHFGIRDVAMSTAWGDMLPFYLANGVQNGWSRGLGVNLLVSGYHQPEEGHLGSGIFKGYSSDHSALYSFEENSGNVLLVSSVETVSASSLSLPIIFKESANNVGNYAPKTSLDLNLSIKESTNLKSSDRPHKFLYEDLSQYANIIMDNFDTSEVAKNTVCSRENFCCYFSYKYSGNQTYYLLAYNGNITLGEGTYTIGTQICAIVWCQNSDYKTCGYIEADSKIPDAFHYLEIHSNSFSVDAIYPILNHRNKSLIRNDILDFEMQDNYSSIKSVKVVENLLTISLQGKRFFKDN